MILPRSIGERGSESKRRFNSQSSIKGCSGHFEYLRHEVTNGVTNLRGSADLDLGSPLDAFPRERTGGLQACVVTEQLKSAQIQVEATQYGRPQHQ
jgi:hypothetical protein